MISAEQSAQVKELLANAQTVMVIVGGGATIDQVAAANALVTGLENQGKSALLLAPRQFSPELTDRLPGLPEVHTELGNRDLSISFAYRPEAVDKVSYHIDEENQRFHLVIKPQKGEKPLDNNTVEFSYTGADADLIFMVGVHEFEALEQLYFGYEQLYSDTMVVTFHTFETSIGAIKLNTTGSSSLSEAMALFVQELEIPLTSDSATQLLLAIEDSTDSFKSLGTTADTFEVVAQLLRFGARRLRRAPKAPAALSTSVVSSGSTPVVNSAAPTLAEAMSTKKSTSVSKTMTKKAGGLDYQPSSTAVSGG